MRNQPLGILLSLVFWCLTGHSIAQSPSYKFYWGAIEAKLQPDSVSGGYQGVAHTSISELSGAVGYGPKLWNGKTMEPEVSLVFNGVKVRNVRNNPDVYNAIKKMLLDYNYMEHFKEGDEAKLTRVSLPNGKFAEITLVFDQRNKFMIQMRSEFRMNNARRFTMEDLSIRPPATIWGDEQFSPRIRLYCTRDEFWRTLKKRPIAKKENGETFVPDEYDVQIWDEKGETIRPTNHLFDLSFDGLTSLLAEMKEILQPGVVVWVMGKDKSGEDARAFGTNMGFFHIVPDNDPRLNLTYAGRKNYNFEWGYYAAFLWQMYASDVFKRWDQPDSIIRYVPDKDIRFTQSVSAKRMIDMMNVPARLYQENTPIPNVGYTMEYTDKKVKITNGIFPTEMQEFIRNNAEPNQHVILRDLRADSMYFPTVVFDFQIAPDSVNDSAPMQAIVRSVPVPIGNDKAHLQITASGSAKGIVSISFYLPKPQLATFFITNSKSKIVFSKSGQFEAGENALDLETGNVLSRGTYELSMQTSEFGMIGEKLRIE
jgi:hypothetical protein